MSAWRLSEFVTDDERFPLADWFRKQDSTVSAGVIAAIRVLKTYGDANDVPTKLLKDLSRADVGLTEIRATFTSVRTNKRRKIRLLCTWDAERAQLVVLCGAEEVNQGYAPANAMQQAHTLRQAFLEGRGLTRDLHI